MVDATVSFVIEKLSNFLIQEVNIRTGVKDALRWLKDELGYLRSWVKDAEGTQETDPLVALWINSIRDVATDAEIILDRISVIQKENAAKKQSIMDRLWSFICMCNKEANLYEIGKEIELLRGRVVEIKRRRDEYNIGEILADRNRNLGKRKRTLLRATSFENQVDVVGFDDDYRTLLTELVREDPTLNAISIHGMGGLGKTTIASKLYHSSELSQFQSRAWVCVSEDYNIKDVLRKIIKSFMGHEEDSLDKMDEIELLRKLQNLLQDRGRYLAVIDDVWDINVWEKIKKAFPDKKNGSRVIITTRNKEIAQRVDDRCFVHQLRFLTDDESWELFYKRAKPTKNQEKLGKEMVSKCRGLPLAIVVLSGLLLHKNWEDVKDRLWRKLKGESMEIQEILSLSYNDLSFPMKQCFLYLSRFPEDCMIYVKDLMLLWIAEEFITEADEGDGIVMEDLAKDYLHELLNRNMIQVQVMGLNGEVSICRMHDLVRDLAIQKARENKLLGIFNSTKVSESPNNLLQGQPRHAIYERIGEYIKSIVRSSDDLRLRSLAVVPTGYTVGVIELEEMKLMFTRLTYLKVLDLRYAKSGKIPEEIGDLVLLKFLGLVAGGGDNYDDLKGVVIPPTIGKLKMLQTLCDARDGRTKYNYPREINKLEKLRHLKILEYEGNLSINSSHQTKLQTLYLISSKDWMKIDTVNFSNLRTLGLSVSGNADSSLDSLANLISLQTLYLSCEEAGVFMPTMKPLLSCKRLKSLSLFGPIKDPSELQSIPDSVTYLGLFCSELTQDPMPILESLSNLTTLFLCDTYGGKKMVCSNDGLPSLQFLVIRELYHLEELKVDEGALSSLKGLTIQDCFKLNKVSERVKCIPRIPAPYDVVSELYELLYI